MAAHVWKESPAPAIGVFERLGFVLRKSCPNFWFDDSKKRDYRCPLRHHPCTCTALIYVADLAAEQSAIRT